MTANYTFLIGPGPGSSEAVQLPLPAQEDGIQMEYFPIGSSGRTANGTYRVQHVTSKWRVRVVWRGLSEAERTTVWTAYVSYIAFFVDVVFPNGLAVTGYVDLASWAETQWFDPHQNRVLYNVSFTIVEA